MDFDTVYQDHFSDVRRLAFGFVQDGGVADELTHDAFAKAYQKWDSYRGEAPVRLWLLKIARNVCLDFMRSPRARDLNVTSLEEAVAGDVEAGGVTGIVNGCEQPSVELAARRAEMSECVQRFVLGLPETLRTPLILHDVEGLNNAEIAHVLGCSLEAAKMRLHRARGRLREMMQERCDLFHDERNVLSCLPLDERARREQVSTPLPTRPQ